MSTADVIFHWIALASIAANLWHWIRSEHSRRKRPRYRPDHRACERFPDWKVQAGTNMLSRRQAE